jgi:hypothetical protein
MDTKIGSFRLQNLIRDIQRDIQRVEKQFGVIRVLIQRLKFFLQIFGKGNVRRQQAAVLGVPGHPFTHCQIRTLQRLWSLRGEPRMLS